MRERLRRDLRRAMTQRETSTVRAIRSLLSAIDNAEAVPMQETSQESTYVAGAVAGAGAGDRARRELTGTDLARILDAEVTERVSAREEYLSAGHQDAAQDLAREIAVLQRYANES